MAACSPADRLARPDMRLTRCGHSFREYLETGGKGVAFEAMGEEKSASILQLLRINVIERAFEIKAGETSGGGARLAQLTINRMMTSRDDLGDATGASPKIVAAADFASRAPIPAPNSEAKKLFALTGASLSDLSPGGERGKEETASSR